MIWILLYLLVGLAAGLVAGLLGVGGGIINVPALNLIFTTLGYDAAHTFHLAIGTSLGIIIFTSASAAYTHYRNGNINLPYALKISLIGIGGSVLGAYLAGLLPGTSLKPLFGGLLCFAGLQMLLDRQSQRPGELRTGWKSAGFIGVVAGLIAGFFGVGGGVAAVPLMLWLSRFEPKIAVATSSVVVVAFALFGTA
ncbi:MAG TPA: sulfite exporter TauE/SafE family protein, partial [bacterium]|nr:sulfite exporter TauE/SafE family protein [bacterium]